MKFKTKLKVFPRKETQLHFKLKYGVLNYVLIDLE